MGKQIIVLCGSPRPDGNTNTVVEWFAEAARERGAEVELVDCSKLDYKANGCTECMGCQKSDKFECVIDDEASEVIKRIAKSDALVLATPIFWMGPSAQLKLVLDRCFALAKFDMQTGNARFAPKPELLGLIATAGGGSEEGLDLVDRTYRLSAKFCKWNYESLLVPFAPSDPKEMAGKTSIHKAAADLTERIAG